MSRFRNARIVLPIWPLPIGLLAAANVICPAGAQEVTGPFSVSAFSSWQPEHYLVAAFCVLGLVIILLEFVLFFRARDKFSAYDVMRTFSTTLILIAVVALLGVGYNQTQVQPALGLFGTALGYLLGRGEALAVGRDETRRRQNGDTARPES
jgi:putative copper export protein